ncbi:MAG TPA: DUF86 domain-containing protein [Bacillota bacterium]|nr:DUF86 domain-containing protein [Bacillota bacterium]
MKDKDRIILKKIAGYIEDADSYVNNLNYDVFLKDSKTMSATAFVLGQIGELAVRISSETETSYPEIDWKGMRGMRNKIVHDYENVDLMILWNTLKNDLPDLLKQIRKILG